jgi:hypothetical protein
MPWPAVPCCFVHQLPGDTMAPPLRRHPHHQDARPANSLEGVSLAVAGRGLAVLRDRLVGQGNVAAHAPRLPVKERLPAAIITSAALGIGGQRKRVTPALNDSCNPVSKHEPPARRAA